MKKFKVNVWEECTKIKIIEAEEMELRKAKKELNAPRKALSSSSRKKSES